MTSAGCPRQPAHDKQPSQTCLLSSCPLANIYPFCISALLLSDGKPSPLSELLLISLQGYTWKSLNGLCSDLAEPPHVSRLKLCWFWTRFLKSCLLLHTKSHNILCYWKYQIKRLLGKIIYIITLWPCWKERWADPLKKPQTLNLQSPTCKPQIHPVLWAICFSKNALRRKETRV